MLCAYLAGALLVGLLGNALFGAWWLDPLVGLLIAAVAVKEGREAWRGEGCCVERASRGSTPARAAERPDADERTRTSTSRGHGDLKPRVYQFRHIRWQGGVRVAARDAPGRTPFRALRAARPLLSWSPPSRHRLGD